MQYEYDQLNTEFKQTSEQDLAISVFTCIDSFHYNIQKWDNSTGSSTCPHH